MAGSVLSPHTITPHQLISPAHTLSSLCFFVFSSLSRFIVIVFSFFIEQEVRENLSLSEEMSSSVAKLASSNDNHEDRNHKERLNLKPLPSDSDPMALSLSLPRETFLRAALSLKDQVRTYAYCRSISARIYRSVLGLYFDLAPPLGNGSILQ